MQTQKRNCNTNIGKALLLSLCTGAFAPPPLPNLSRWRFCTHFWALNSALLRSCSSSPDFFTLVLLQSCFPFTLLVPFCAPGFLWRFLFSSVTFHLFLVSLLLYLSPLSLSLCLFLYVSSSMSLSLCLFPFVSSPLSLPLCLFPSVSSPLSLRLCLFASVSPPLSLCLRLSASVSSPLTLLFCFFPLTHPSFSSICLSPSVSFLHLLYVSLPISLPCVPLSPFLYPSSPPPSSSLPSLACSPLSLSICLFLSVSFPMSFPICLFP
jgi:hypothetical protein